MLIAVFEQIACCVCDHLPPSLAALSLRCVLARHEPLPAPQTQE